MFDPIGQLFRRRALRADVRRALESGVGLYHTTWHIEGGEEDEASDALAAELVTWCRDALGRMHRPYGLDYVTLSVAVLDEADGQVVSTSYGVLRPADFYDPGSVEAQVHETIRHWGDARIFVRGGGGRFSAVLFSWGDLTRELLLAG